VGGYHLSIKTDYNYVGSTTPIIKQWFIHPGLTVHVITHSIRSTAIIYICMYVICTYTTTEKHTHTYMYIYNVYIYIYMYIYNVYI
jgi:hypothetical protein